MKPGWDRTVRVTEVADTHDPAHLRALLAAAVDGFDLSFRPMFGGIMGYAGGKPFASLSNRGLALKLDAAGMDGLVALGGQPLRYEPDDPPSRSYALVPPAMLGPDGGALLGAWAARSAAHVARSPVRRGRARG